MAQDTQYCSFKYILGTVYSGKTEASEISPAQLVSHSITSIVPARESPNIVCSCTSSVGEHTDGGRLDHVPDSESLYRLVLGCASRAVGATDGLDVATTLLVAAAVVLLVFLSPHGRNRYCVLRCAFLDHDGLFLCSVSRMMFSICG
jgi:hypothetical protein